MKRQRRRTSDLKRELKRLHKHNRDLAERLAAASYVLSRVAERNGIEWMKGKR